MKFLYITNIRIPTEKAHGLQVMKMCEALVEGGQTVELILPTKGHKFTKHLDPFEFYGVKSRFPITRIWALDPYWLMPFPSGWYIKFQATLFMLSLFFYLLLLRNKKDTVVYTRDEILLPLLQIFFQRVVWEGHNLPTRRGYYKKFWQRCKKIFVLTQSLKEALIRLGVDEKSISVAPDAVDLSSFLIAESKTELRTRLGLPLDKKTVMYTGHLYDWKGAHVLLDAAAYFSLYFKEIKDVLFVFVGGTPDDIRRFADETKARKLANVLIVGFRPHPEIPAYVKSADVLVLPNTPETKISRLYTSPMKLFEYMAAGVPIVASDLPSLHEILDESMAVFFMPGQSQDLAKILREILDHPEHFQKLSAAAGQAVQQYTWHKRAQKIITALT